MNSQKGARAFNLFRFCDKQRNAGAPAEYVTAASSDSKARKGEIRRHGRKRRSALPPSSFIVCEM